METSKRLFFASACWIIWSTRTKLHHQGTRLSIPEVIASINAYELENDKLTNIVPNISQPQDLGHYLILGSSNAISVPHTITIRKYLFLALYLETTKEKYDCMYSPKPPQ